MLNNLKPNSSFFKKGSVIIAGAGPGDINKITLQVYYAIKFSDVIIYDGLVNKKLLGINKKKAKLIFAGKRFGNKSCTQAEIIEWIENYTKNNKRILRLKSGDPSVFGRGSEEISELKRLKIPFKVFSGITAVQEAMKNLNLNYFQNSASFSLVTGHKPLKESSHKIDFQTMGKYNGIIAIYMGLSQIGKISLSLIKGGKKKETTVSIISRISMKDEKVYKSNLYECSKEKHSFGLKSPAIIIIH